MDTTGADDRIADASSKCGSHNNDNNHFNE